MDGSGSGRREREERRGGCAGCDGRTSRRRALGRMSGVALAAMVGVELWPGRATAVPVGDGAGAPAGPAESAYPVPAADGVTIDREAQVILVRFQQRAYAFNLACPHENTALRWKEREGRFQCPRHESRYQPDGTFISGRATRNMDRLAIRRDGDRLVVTLDRLFRSDQQPQDWGAAAVSL
ncbi:MAG TPA: Rieske 2Fe-2S domain-containing protein [Vicinamibacteria bacterium]|nr:Rieske 2Fe-2S domain-containing protein [Vicinamibacteria bacterium]